MVVSAGASTDDARDGKPRSASCFVCTGNQARAACWPRHSLARAGGRSADHVGVSRHAQIPPAPALPARMSAGRGRAGGRPRRPSVSGRSTRRSSRVPISSSASSRIHVSAAVVDGGAARRALFLLRAARSASRRSSSLGRPEQSRGRQDGRALRSPAGRASAALVSSRRTRPVSPRASLWRSRSRSTISRDGCARVASRGRLLGQRQLEGLKGRPLTGFTVTGFAQTM